MEFDSDRIEHCRNAAVVLNKIDTVTCDPCTSPLSVAVEKGLDSGVNKAVLFEVGKVVQRRLVLIWIQRVDLVRLCGINLRQVFEHQTLQRAIYFHDVFLVVVREMMCGCRSMTCTTTIINLDRRACE